MMPKHPPSERVARRAARIWCDLCRNPNIDNGDRSENGGMTHVLMALTVKPATDDTLKLYEDAIVKVLMTPTEHGYYHPDIGCDYGPDGRLKAAHDLLPEGAKGFSDPIKTSLRIDIWNGVEKISVSAGYAAPSIMHYPLPDNQWLKIPSEDIDKALIAFATDKVYDLEIYTVDA